MSQRPIRRRITKSLASGAGGAVLLLLGAIAVFGQGGGGTEVGGPYPRLPGAAARPPDGVATGTGAPFDVARYFAAPPRASNAAPLYLDALFEFGGEMDSCFPEGPERERRRQAAEDRYKRYMEVQDALTKNAKSVPDSSIDEVVKSYETGFRKLAAAQRRERCVFETGIGITSLLPHVQVARQVARVASLRVRRAVERRDFDGAIRDVEMVLRLVRDLQPRGPFITQLVAAAMTQFVCVDTIPRILVARGLREEHCNRLLKVLAEHDAKATDGYVEGLRAEYLSARVTLQDLVRHQPELAKQLQKFGVKPGTSVVKALLETPQGLGPSAGPARPLPDDVDARVARTSPAELARVVRDLDGNHRMLIGLDGIPYAARLARIEALKPAAADDPLSRIAMAIQVEPAAGLTMVVRSISRATATLHATECLVALRRWQLTHRSWPRDLASAVKGTALKGVPADPYDGKPMRMVVLDKQPIVYSVGRDGRDDGGQKDSNLDIKPDGDLTYRLPTPEGQRQSP
jgi:hypothetical protein